MTTKTETDFDVIIIGSGPAGGMAAIQCATGGLKTALFEKEELPRRKVCAGGLLKRAAALLPDDLDYPVESRCDSVELRLYNPDKTFRETRENLVSMVSRVHFDYSLVKHAEKNGATIFSGAEVRKVVPSSDHIQISTQEKTYTCSFLVLAEGANARISNQFWEDDRVLIPAIESEIMLPKENLAEYAGVARFDFDIVPCGYGWVFPKSDHVSVGIGGFTNKKINLQKTFDNYKEVVGLTKDYEERNRKGFIIPIKPRKAPFMKQRMILVGDAAGFADPITAEGFTYAIKSGLEAGNALVNGATPEEVSKLYHDAIEEGILQELAIATKFTKPFYFSNRLKKMLFEKYGDRLSRGMASLAEGNRTYREALGKKSLMSRFFKGFH